MNRMPEWPWPVDGNVSPVILPIGSPTNSAWERLQCLSANGEQGAVQVKRFTFPAIGAGRGEGSLDESSYAIWPKCECAEAVRAGVNLAKAIRGRLPADRSSVVAFTSPGDGDGKTTLVEVLAPELASRTPGGALVADADFRKSDLTARLAFPAAGNSVGSNPMSRSATTPAAATGANCCWH